MNDGWAGIGEMAEAREMKNIYFSKLHIIYNVWCFFLSCLYALFVFGCVPLAVIESLFMPILLWDGQWMNYFSFFVCSYSNNMILLHFKWNINNVLNVWALSNHHHHHHLPIIIIIIVVLIIIIHQSWNGVYQMQGEDRVLTASCWE